MGRSKKQPLMGPSVPRMGTLMLLEMTLGRVANAHATAELYQLERSKVPWEWLGGDAEMGKMNTATLGDTQSWKSEAQLEATKSPAEDSW